MWKELDAMAVIESRGFFESRPILIGVENLECRRLDVEPFFVQLRLFIAPTCHIDVLYTQTLGSMRGPLDKSMIVCLYQLDQLP